jgi:succinate-semialdehyde dehydrogenase / glutarate-semialdehyde dehydrogenase
MPTRSQAAARYPELGQLIAGAFETGGDRRMEVIDPSTGAVLGDFPMAGEHDVARALSAAESGFETWRRTPAFERGKVLRAVADTMRARADELAELVVLELGKPWKEALGEVEQAAGMWEWAAEEGRRAYGRVIPSRENGSRQMVLREPIGPIGAFGSWNAPLITPSRKMAGALGAGCSIVFKASEEVPACALALGHIAYECGLPKGALSIVVGDAVMISDALLESSVIRGITFTGSTEIGMMLSSRAVQQMKRPIMELGGHAPVLVFDDVDPVATARAAAGAKFRNSGQICIAPTRFFVQRPIYAEFIEALAEAALALKPGCGFEKETTMGPLVSPRRISAMEEFIADARDQGLDIRAGGAALDRDGSFFEPTVIADVTTDSMVANVEPFGPIAAVTPFNTYEEAIRLANRLPFALAAYVQSSNVHTVTRAIDDVEAGNVICNGWRVSLPETPFGGHKWSGLASEGGIEGLQAFQNVKFAFTA